MDLLILGQAPGPEEDEDNRCFVGPVGQFLSDLIRESGFLTRSIWLDNVVRCYPPGDAKPKVAHVDACLAYLNRVLEEKKPKFIVAMGEVALNAVCQTKGMMKWVGVPRKSWDERFEVFPVFHPSYVLHNDYELGKMIALFKGIKNWMDQKAQGMDPRGQTRVEFCDNIDIARKLFEERFKTLTAFDYETTSLDPRKGVIRCVGMCDEPGLAFVFPIDEPNCSMGEGFKTLFKTWLEDTTPKVAHNAGFEAIWSRHHFGVWPEELVDDTRRMQHLLNEELYADLGVITMSQIPELAGYDAKVNAFLAGFKDNGEGYTKCPMLEEPKLFHYCGQDCDATLRLHHVFKAEIEKDDGK